jgi:UDP-N-acetylmuramoyl-L-alanyl-D-glutamate--2,6-diaminopimelate ligase
MTLKAAKPGDIILIAGKGHEKTQTLKNGTIPFDDAEVAATILNELQARVKA